MYETYPYSLSIHVDTPFDSLRNVLYEMNHGLQ